MIISSSFYCRKHSRVVPRVGVGASCFRGEQLEHSESGSNSRVLYILRACTCSIYGCSTLDTLSTASISDACTAGTACTRGLALLTFPLLALFGPSLLLILPVLGVRNVLDTPSRVFRIPGASVQPFPDAHSTSE